MKEIVVADRKQYINKTDFVCVDDIIKDLKGTFTIEKVPDTWEDLLFLTQCFDNVTCGEFAKTNKQWMIIEGKTFTEDGTILDEDNDIFAENRTMEQMWTIMKMLRRNNNGNKRRKNRKAK